MQWLRPIRTGKTGGRDRTGAPLALAAGVLAISFGAFASCQGWPPWATVLMSATVFSGSAQFAFVTATSGGAGLLTGLAASALMNLRFVPMAAASAPSLHGGRLQQALEGQAVVDGSWVAAQRLDGTTNRGVDARGDPRPVASLGARHGRRCVPGALGRRHVPLRARRDLPASF